MANIWMLMKKSTDEIMVKKSEPILKISEILPFFLGIFFGGAILWFSAWFAREVTSEFGFWPGIIVFPIILSVLVYLMSVFLKTLLRDKDDNSNLWGP